MNHQVDISNDCDESTGEVEGIERHIGMRIRLRRHVLGLSQMQLANLADTTHQQMHKYETGLCRVPAARLYTIARALGVPVDHFFEGYREADGEVLPRHTERLVLELTRSFMAIVDHRQQMALYNLTRAMAEQEAAGMSPANGAIVRQITCLSR